MNCNIEGTPTNGIAQVPLRVLVSDGLGVGICLFVMMTSVHNGAVKINQVISERPYRVLAKAAVKNKLLKRMREN